MGLCALEKWRIARSAVLCGGNRFFCLRANKVKWMGVHRVEKQYKRSDSEIYIWILSMGSLEDWHALQKMFQLHTHVYVDMRLALLTFLTVLGIIRVTSRVSCKGCAKSTRRSAIFTAPRQQVSQMSHFYLTVCSLDLIFRLLFRPTDTQYINSNVYFVKYSDMFWCIDIIFRGSFLI
jgi:hypothetical protein